MTPVRIRPAAAARFLVALQKALQTLSRHPAAGSTRYAHVVPTGGLRMWPLTGFPHLIFYFVRSDHVDIVRVLHGARDVPSILREGGESRESPHGRI